MKPILAERMQVGHWANKHALLSTSIHFHPFHPPPPDPTSPARPDIKPKNQVSGIKRGGPNLTAPKATWRRLPNLYRVSSIAQVPSSNTAC